MHESHEANEPTASLPWRLRIPGAALLVIDAVAWCIAVVFAMAIRFDFDRGLWTPWTPEVIVLVAVVVMASIGGLFGLYDGRWRRGRAADFPYQR